jgi:hypothetical protein
LRAETRSPFSRAHSKTRAAVASAAQPHLLVGADDQPQLAKWTAVAERLHRHRRQHQAALHVGDAGAEAVQPLAPERPLGDGAQREDGVAVSEQCDHPVGLAGQ